MFIYHIDNSVNIYKYRVFICKDKLWINFYMINILCMWWHVCLSVCLSIASVPLHGHNSFHAATVDDVHAVHADADADATAKQNKINNKRK